MTLEGTDQGLTPFRSYGFKKWQQSFSTQVMNHFFKWIKENPNGYVINTASRSFDWFLKMHKPQCHHISGYTKDQKGGAFTQKEYIKICANNALDLIEWVTSNNKTIESHRICKSCSPEYCLFEVALPEEIRTDTKLSEGSVREIKVNAYVKE